MSRRPWGSWWPAFALAPLIGVLAIGLGLFAPGRETVVRRAALPAYAAVPAVDVSAVPPADEAPAGPAEPAHTDSDVPPPAPAAAELPPPDACTDALDWVAGAGLVLPDGVGYRCPSTEFAHQGAACWYTACPGDAHIAINMDRLAGAGVEYLRHVVAHEVCHILDWQGNGWTTEAGADACAAAHGAPA